jgi:hypothetical protein
MTCWEHNVMKNWKDPDPLKFLTDPVSPKVTDPRDPNLENYWFGKLKNKFRPKMALLTLTVESACFA